MTQATTAKLRFAGIVGTLVLAVTLLTAPASFAGERGDRWQRDRGPRIERHYDRHRQARRHRRADRYTHRRGDRRTYRYKPHRGQRHGQRHGHQHGRRHGHYGHRRGHSLAPLVARIGLGILTYAIIDSHRGY